MQRTVVLIGVVVIGLVSTAQAHVPVIECSDFSAAKPGVIAGTVEKSIAVYAWLEDVDDVDVFCFTLRGDESLVFVSSLVPRCECYAAFLPYIAVAGAGLEGYPGALKREEVKALGYTRLEENLISDDPLVIVENYDLAGGQVRDTFFEFFAHKWYFGGPDFIWENPGKSGIYYIYVWVPEIGGDSAGDYVLEVGRQEIWTLREILRTFLFVLPWLVANGEIHDPDCNPRF